MTRKPSTSPHRSHPSPRRGVSVLSFLFSVLFALPASVGLLRSLSLRVPLWSFVSFVMTHKPSTVPHRSHPSPRRGVSVLSSLFSVLFALHAPALTLPLLDEGPVRAGFESAAETLSYEAPLEGTLWIETPAAAEARLPPDFRDRFRGFAVVEDFAEGRTETAGRARAAWRLRLTPAAEGPWRLRPFVLTVRDRRTGAMQDYATRLAAFPEALTSSIEGMQRAMLENRKKQGGGMPKRAKDFARECNRLYRLLDGPAASSQAFRLYFSSSRGRSANLYCLDPSSFLAHSMSRLRACIVFSATLSPIHYYVTSITGGDDSPRISFPSPFDPAKMKLLLAPYVSTKYKDRKGSLSDLCSLLELFVAGRKGNYFIFFPSYEYLRQAELCLSFPGAEVYSQTRDMDIESRLSFLEHFPSNPECSHVGLLVMGGPFSEGIDLPEDRLIGVAVVGVGMPQISFENDLIREYRDQKEEDGFAYAYRDPGLNKVMQALGRLIRTENDVGAGLLIDTRYLTSPYREPIGKRYPNYEVVLSEDDLKNSLASFYKKAKLI